MGFSTAVVATVSSPLGGMQPKNHLLQHAK
jgi:hypothetical protein